jgi:inhibitor of cysteine peptidase
MVSRTPVVVLGLVALVIGFVAGFAIGQTNLALHTKNTVLVHVNENFHIALDSNPTTGYQWQLAKVSDQNILQLVETEYKASESRLVGAGGKQILTFRALKEGKATVTLEYARSWEKDKPGRIYVLDVIVRP